LRIEDCGLRIYFSICRLLIVHALFGAVAAVSKSQINDQSTIANPAIFNKSAIRNPQSAI
jgi:hypothetical protein